MGRSRFYKKNKWNEGDPFVQLLYDLSRPTATPDQQAAFLKGSEFHESQDIMATQRMKQIEHHRRINRAINGTEITIWNSGEWWDFYDRESTNPCNKSLTEEFYHISKVVYKRERCLTPRYPVVDRLLVTTPYLRHLTWLAGLFVMNSWRPMDVDA